MISRKRKTLTYVLLFVMCAILPLTIFTQNAHAYVIEEAEVTYRYGTGNYAEVTLHVTCRIYQGGYRTFSYASSHSEGTKWPWIPINGYSSLFDDGPGVKTARNWRVWLCVIFTYEICVEVHFNENNMNFYSSVWYRNNAVQVTLAIMELRGKFSDYRV